jgi:hypothetical protein
VHTVVLIHIHCLGVLAAQGAGSSRETVGGTSAVMRALAFKATTTTSAFRKVRETELRGTTLACTGDRETITYSAKFQRDNAASAVRIPSLVVCLDLYRPAGHVRCSPRSSETAGPRRAPSGVSSNMVLRGPLRRADSVFSCWCQVELLSDSALNQAFQSWDVMDAKSFLATVGEDVGVTDILVDAVHTGAFRSGLGKSVYCDS